MNKRILAFFTVGTCLCVAPATANAQAVAGQGPAWLQDRTATEGVGIRTGNLEIHPGIGVEGGYDSNFFLRSSKTDPTLINAAPNAPVEASGRLRITPSISLTTLGARRLSDGGGGTTPAVTFDLAADASYLEFFGSDQLSRHRNVSANGRADLRILPSRPVGFEIGLRYTRLINPFVTGDPNLAFNQDRLSARAAIVVAPGGGALELRGGYQFNGNVFAQTPLYTNLIHDAFVQSRWRFTPRTSLLSDVTVSFYNYANALQPGSVLLNGTPVRARAGFDGLVTDKLGVQALLGYGATLFEERYTTVRQFSSLIATARVTWFFLGAGSNTREVSTIAGNLSVGYGRDFGYSFLGNYLVTDRPYIQFETMISGRALITLTGGLGIITYPDLPQIGNPNALRTTGFTNLRPDVTAFLEYRFTDSFGVNATAKYGQNVTDTILPDPSTGLGWDLAWTRFEAYGGVRWFL